ncbi:DeoR/GlpR family transcriptional regulator [Serratia ureilytica]
MAFWDTRHRAHTNNNSRELCPAGIAGVLGIIVKQTQRHDAIIELVRLQGYVSTEELVEHFDVSPQTIRRDLNDLADQNKIQRHHGGAALPSSSVNAAYNDRKVMWSEEKARIAQRVASQIPDGATLFIDIGTTPEAVAHALMNHKNLRVVTNNLNVATLLTAKEDFRLIPPAAKCAPATAASWAKPPDFISQFRLDYGILGISGIDMDGSLLEFDYHEVRTKRAIIENSRCVMLVTDHLKFGRNAMVNLGNMNLIDYLFTDQLPPPSVMKIIEQYDVQLELC